MNPKKRVAVVMTCHNRAASTNACLRALSLQRLDGVAIDLFVTDDGCTDNTCEVVREWFPSATIVGGDGTLYWAAGMALAEREASRTQPDFFLWLNDDAELFENAVAGLLEGAGAAPNCIVVGATKDPTDGQFAYGLRRRLGSHPQRFVTVEPTDTMTFGDAFNGNVVLIPRQVHAMVGPIDDLFDHAYADDDYGLRASRVGVRVAQVAGYVGTCPRNMQRPLPSGSLFQRWEQLEEPLGLPLRSQMRYLRRHAPRSWPVLVAWGRVKALVSKRVVSTSI